MCQKWSKCCVLLCVRFPDALIWFRLESSSHPVVTAHRKNGGVVQVYHTNYNLLLILCPVGQNMSTFPLVLVTVLLYVVRILLRWVRGNSNSLITFAQSWDCWGQMIFTAGNPGTSFSDTAFVLEVLSIQYCPCSDYSAYTFCYQLGCSAFTFKLHLFNTMGRAFK